MSALKSCSSDFFDRAVTELDQLLSRPGLASHFQVIFDLESRQPLGFEALTRCPENSIFTSPMQLFAMAQRVGRLHELSAHCMSLALDRFAELNLPGKLFLNVVPGGPDCLTDLVADSALNDSDDRVVLELSELHPFEDLSALQTFGEKIRTSGVEVALDDLGTGYSGLKTWSQLHPEYIKIDRHFITDIHSDTVKREFVRSIAEIARGLRCHVIAEGVETLDELLTLRMLHVRYVQGYLIHRPEAAPALPLNVSGLGQLSSVVNVPAARPSETVAAIMKPVEPFETDVFAEIVNERFQKNLALNALPVVKGDQLVGMVTRKLMTELFSQRFAHALYGRKSIGELATTPVVVDWATPLQEVSRLVTARDAEDMDQDIVVTRNGRYAGIAKVAALLKNITEMQIRSARYSNPLTQLPGNVPIYEEVDALLRSMTAFHIAYFDINSFKPFNDYYGYSLGDEVISCLAAVLCDAVCPQQDFVGHIGGDDFVVLFRSPDWEERCQRVLIEFERRSREFYHPEDLAQGFILGEDRSGAEKQFPLLSLAIGVAFPDPDHCFSHHDVAMLATEAKYAAKRAGCNHLFVERRRRPSRPLPAERPVSPSKSAAG